MTSIMNFRLEAQQFSWVGRDLVRPECVVVEPNGTLWVSDNRGIATRIDPDGTQALLGPEVHEPNGLAIDADGSLVAAAMSGGKVYRMSRDGRAKVLLDSVGGAPLGAVNFCLRDALGRLWISMFSSRSDWWTSLAARAPDGYLVLLDEKGPRVVAEGIRGLNEVRLDARGEWLYAVETMGARVLRFPVRPDGSLGEREVFGPEGYGPGGYVDGLAFDAEGNLWLTIVCRNAIVVVTPDGRAHTVFEEPNEQALASLEDKFARGTAEPADLGACAGRTLSLPTSIAFGGPDLRTCYVGSLAMPRLATFHAPVPGLPLAHWTSA